MKGERRHWSVRVGLAALAWGWAVAVPWHSGRPAVAQDAPGDLPKETDSTFLSLRTFFLPNALKERLDQFMAMTPAQQADLMEHRRQLAKLDPAEQERLRSLCQEINERPNAEELRKVMRHYYDWLTTLAPSVQAELLELPRAQRVARIQQMLEEQAKRASKGPGSQAMGGADPYRRAVSQYGGRAWFFNPVDMVGLLEWLDTYVAEHGTELLKEISASHREELKKQLAQIPGIKDTLHRHEVVATLMLRWQLDHPGKMPAMEDRDLQEMRARLSERTRERLQRQPLAEQWRNASGLIGLFVVSQRGPHGAHPQVTAVADDELVKFFEKELSAKDRDWLLSLPGGGERISQELLRRYIYRKLYQGSDRPPGFFGPWEKRGGPPGPRFGPGRGPDAKDRPSEKGRTDVRAKGAVERPEVGRQESEVKSDKGKVQSEERGSARHFALFTSDLALFTSASIARPSRPRALIPNPQSLIPSP